MFLPCSIKNAVAHMFFPSLTEVPQTSPEVPGPPQRSVPFSGKPDTL